MQAVQIFNLKMNCTAKVITFLVSFFKGLLCRGNPSYFTEFKSNVFDVVGISDAIVTFKRKLFTPNILI